MNLPCLECGGQCCIKGPYGSKHACWVGVHENFPRLNLLVDMGPLGGWLPYDKWGRCVMLTAKGRCQLHDTPHKPEHCRRGSCVVDGIVDRIDGLRALLTRNGVVLA